VETTFEEFAAARLPAILRYATALAGRPELAEDIVQDVLLRAQRRWRRIGATDRPDLYVKRMVLNEYLGWRRRRSSTDLVMSSDMLDGLGLVPDHAQRSGDRDAVRRGLALLPRKQRAVLLLRYYEGLPDAEIAALLGCGAGTVRSHASRAIATLRAALGPAAETVTLQHRREAQP
jgi:RNA polymerase sigma-70 factor (sigma-E family)